MGKVFKVGCLGVIGVAVVAIILAAIGSQMPKSVQQATAPVPGTQQAVPAAPAAKPTDRPAPTEKPGPTAVPQLAIGKVGEPIEAGGMSLLVSGVTRTDKAGTFSVAKPGNVILVVDVTLESPGRDESPYNPLYFKVRDADGFEASASLVGPDPSLKSGKLSKGEKVRGNLAFEIKTEAKGLVLAFEPIVLLGGYKQIRVALGQ